MTGLSVSRNGLPHAVLTGDLPSWPVLQLGDLRIDPSRHSVIRAGRAVTLTRLEFRILYLLAAQPGRLVSYGSLLREVWGYTAEEQSSALVKPHIWNLRRKLNLDSSGQLLLQAVQRQGYMLQEA